MQLILEELERRIVLAVPIAPFDLDLLAGSDTGSSSADDITNQNNATIELIAETNSTVTVYNFGGSVGTATGQNDVFLYETTGTIIIEAEWGTLSDTMATGGGGAWITTGTSSVGNPRGIAEYDVYITTADRYYFRAWNLFPSQSQNSFFVNVDDVWQAGDNGPGCWGDDSVWQAFTPTNQVNNAPSGTAFWDLDVGWHTIEIHGREPDFRLDKFALSTNVAADPSAAASPTYETFQFTFDVGELIGSGSGTTNQITAVAANLDGAGPASSPLALTYDNAAPAKPSTPDLSAADDSGLSSTDNLTNIPDPVISGYAEPNTTVTIDVNAAAHTTTVTAAADGSWSHQITNGWLAPGNNDIFVTATDLAGNTSVAGNTLTINYDATAAAPVPAPDLAAASDTGSDNTDNITNDTTPFITGPAGSVDANATVTVRVAGINKQSTTANGDGSWSLTLAAGDLAQGNNTLDYFYTDLAGNTSADSPNLIINLDTISDQPAAADLTAATDTGAADNDNITRNHLCQITGTAVRDATIHIIVNGAEVNTTASDGAGAWSYTFTNGQLTEGHNTLTVTAEDEHGNAESIPSTPLIVTLDRILAVPSVPDLLAASDNGISNSDNITSVAAPWFSGSAEPGATVQIYVGAAGLAAAVADPTTGAWSIQLNPGNLVPGVNNVTAHATDAAGNTAVSAALSVTYNSAAAVPNAPRLLAASDSGFADDDRITNIATVTIYGSVADGNPVPASATVHLRTNKNAAGWNEVAATIADLNGNWSYVLATGNLAQGSNLVDIYITDVSNNTSGNSADLTITLDQTANTPLPPDLTAATDTGSADNDNITNNTFPAFTGTIEANARAYLRIDGAVVKNALADGAGIYTLTLAAGEMAPATHLVDVYYVDVAGNTSAVSSALTVVLDTTVAAPLLAADLDPASDSGSSTTDNLTNDTTATITAPAGSVEANSSVTLRVASADARTTTANPDGSWSITLFPGDLAVGNNTIDYYYTDPAGNSSADSPNLTVTLDTAIAAPAAPDLAAFSDTGTDDTDNITAESRPTISGPAASVEPLSVVAIWLDTPTAPDTAVGQTTAAADGSWSYTFTAAAPLEEGLNVIHLVATDPAGNVSIPSADLNVTVDFGGGAELPPDLLPASDTGTSSVDNITRDTTPAISGVCPAGALVKIRTNETAIVQFTDNGPGDANPLAGQWTYTFAAVFAEGPNTIDYLTIDTANHISDWTLDLVITLDTNITQPSTPDLTVPSDTGANNADNLTNDSTPTLTGTAEPDSIVTININAAAHTDTAAVGANGLWTYTVPAGWLNEGNNTIFVTATDPAGNNSLASGNLTITLDTTINIPTAPDLTAATDTGASTTDNLTSHANPRITGAADPLTTITVRLDPNGAATPLGTAFADVLGNWSFTFAAADLAEGANSIDVLATDAAGNSADSAELTITIETAISAPANLDLLAASDLGALNNDNLTSLAAATITGDADPNSTVYVRVNGTVVGSTAANGAGDWTFTFDGANDLIEGTNVVDAYATDNTGNVSGYSPDLVIKLDTAVALPDAPDLDSASDTGAVTTDNITNDPTPTITGTCEAGATLFIHLNGTDGFATLTDADLDGRWSYTFAAGLNGSAIGTANTIKIAQRDLAGNLSAYGAALTVTLDNSAQTPAPADLIALSDTGDADNDNLTNLYVATVTGTVEAGSSLQLFVNGNLIDTISELLVASGQWSYTFTAGQLTEGVNLVTTIATDHASNVSAPSAPLAITLDQTVNTPAAPDLDPASDTGDLDDDDVTSDNTPTLNGTSDPNSHITIRVNGQAINTVDADAAGNWTYTFALGEINTGVRQIDVVATDPAGNISAPSDDLTIWLNVQPTQPARPNLLAASDSGLAQTDNLTYITNPTIDGKADTNRTIFVYVHGLLAGTTTSDNDGFYTFQFDPGDLLEGDNAVTIITEDSSGLRSAESFPLNITLDTTAPPAVPPDLQPGSDTGASDTDNLTSDRTATIEGAGEANARIDIYLDNQHLRQLMTTATGFWSYTFSPDALTEGLNSVTITVTDVAGNLSAVSAALVITLDCQQPTPGTPALIPQSDTGISDTDRLTNNNTPVIQGVTGAHNDLRIIVSGITVADIVADENGAWRYDFQPGQITEGLNVIEVVSTDSGGNTARSEPLPVNLDQTPPTLFSYTPMGTHTRTTNTIELFLAADDLDTLAAADTDGYVLLGSGGDHTFDDGNEWIIPIAGVTVDTVSGLVQLTTAILLTDDHYQLTIDPSISLRDQAGNPAQFNRQTSVLYTSLNDAIVIAFEIDTAGPPAPQTPVLDPLSDTGASDNDRITGENRPLIRISAQPNVSVQLICNGRSAGFANEIQPGQYELIISDTLLREGENLLLARAFDGLGNSSELSGLTTFIFDSTHPTVAGIITDDLYLNTGPTQLHVVFADSDLDLDTLNSPENYRLLAAGGDGRFNDGNETFISFTDIHFDAELQSLVLTLPQTATGTSQLGPDVYQLTILSNSTIADFAGNILNQSTTSEFTVVEAPVLHANQRLTVTTAAGSSFTISLIGPGEARILLGDSIGSDNLIERLSLSGTTTTSMLMISAWGANQTITLGRLLVDGPLSAILASRVVITDQMILQGNVARVTLAGLAENSVTSITARHGLTFTVDTIAAGAALDILGPLDLFRAHTVVAAALAADDIGMMIITSAFDAEVSVRQGNLDFLMVQGSSINGSLNITGRLGQLIAPRATITADITAQNIGAISADTLRDGLFRSAADISSIRVKTAANATVNAAGDLKFFFASGTVTNSQLAAGRDINTAYFLGDCIDNLLLAGADLGPDARLDGTNDTFADGNIDMLMVRGTFNGTTAAAAIDPGPDGQFFTPDDQSNHPGSIRRLLFSPTTLTDTLADHNFGLLATSPFPSLTRNHQPLTAPYSLNQLLLRLI